MYRYYAAPVRRQGRTLSADPSDGACALADSPHDASLRLGLSDAGEMFAVWVIGNWHSPDMPAMLSREAETLCSKIPPSRIFVCLGDGLVLPLGIDPTLDVGLESSHAGSN